MTIELAMLISIISVVFGLYQGSSNLKRNSKADTKTDATQMTTVIVKLENIGNGISEIKTEMGNVKEDMKDIRDRVIRVEESSRQAHKRLDGLEKER